MANKKHTDIQNEIISKYSITVCPYCIKNYRTRMHAHLKERTVCKWTAKNSVKATFDLFHEIGHIETTTPKMRRCEEEYYATQWAIDRFKEYDLEIPDNIKKSYQNYINRELCRGLRKSGANYPKTLDLKW